MKRILLLKGIAILLLSLLFSSGCQEQTRPDLDAEKAKILEMHHAQRNYHFEKDSLAFADQMSEHFISVNRGIISRPTREELLARYNRYFSSVEFLKWDDVSDPVIRFSDDGSMAYTVVDKIVRVRYTDAEGNSEEGETHFAWTTIYRKYGDQWKIDGVTSTNKPEAD
ncbi:nuclear transport factor 2 family protein [Poritiphilus flavus]|uniref:DUF4440 domain-containing protein n=1 Tax=Poritiphilus flavus TaxID=2697053 RepID=A0A6L9EHF8_9FLAO|nr:nuclear transport factor 2 family protein [Poritiphilus flavus]NAS14096.1 DUF4440 domain-containing protein [Poritiphilus flavus]